MDDNACLHCISPLSITVNRKVIDYRKEGQQGRAESSNSYMHADTHRNANILSCIAVVHRELQPEVY